MPAKAGGATWPSAGSHLPQNVGDKPFQFIRVDLEKTPRRALISRPGRAG